MKIIFLLVVALSSISLTTISQALPSDSEQELAIDADYSEIDEPLGTITYSGNVLMQQGSMTIGADKVVVHGTKNRATKVVATGEPAEFQQTPRLGQEPVQAKANELEYTVSSKSLLLQGNALLKQEGTSLSSGRIEYDVQKSVVKAYSSEENTDGKKRVRMVIPPKLLESDLN